jgi:hypothetical protein
MKGEPFLVFGSPVRYAYMGLHDEGYICCIWVPTLGDCRRDVTLLHRRGGKSRVECRTFCPSPLLTSAVYLLTRSGVWPLDKADWRFVPVLPLAEKRCGQHEGDL